MLQSCIFKKENISSFDFCSLLFLFYLFGDEISADCFKDEITPSSKPNDRLKIAQDVALNHVRNKGKP